MDISAERFCVFASNEAYVPYNEEECCTPKGVVSPLAVISLTKFALVHFERRTLYRDLTRAPTSPVTTMTSSISMVYSMVGHGRPAVRRRSKSKSGVVMALDLRFSHGTYVNESPKNNLPIDVTDVKDLAVLAMDKRVAAKELYLDWCPPEVRSHTEVSNSCNHSDCRSDVVEDPIGTLFRSRKSNEAEG